MYRFVNYGKLFEQGDTTPLDPTQMGVDPAKMETPAAPAAVLSPELDKIDVNTMQVNVQLAEADKASIKPNSVFVKAAKLATKSNPAEMMDLPEIQVALVIAASNDTANAVYPAIDSIDTANTFIFKVTPNQVANLTTLEMGKPVPLSLKADNTTNPITVQFEMAAQEQPMPATQPEQTVTDGVPTSTQMKTAIETGELLGTAGANPYSENRGAILSFDRFVSEAKKEKWIGDVKMKKGALRKEMKKGKEEKITAAEISKSEAKLKKKDKDKKKPGLQLDKKDAKTHKRNVLAKNLMKASGAMHESREGRIKGLKDQLVKLHEVVEKMIAQTSRKNKGI